MITQRFTIILAVLIAIILVSPIRSYSSPIIVSGLVADTCGEPVIGASVYIFIDTVCCSGTSTNIEGKYKLTLQGPTEDSITIQVSSVGFARHSIPITNLIQNGQVNCDVVLRRNYIEMNGVKVVARKTNRLRESIGNKEITERGRLSLVATNPISAIQRPQVIRVGSQHSSKIRINGTNPKYYLNGISIGKDPNHFGMFSIIPSSAIEKIELFTLGAPIRYSQTGIVELSTPKRFENHYNGDLLLSFIELTGGLSIGNEKSFALATLRKSVLDKLVGRLNINSDSRAIPPTNFQDIFISTGYKLSPSLSIVIDQFHTRDYLAYKTSPTTNNLNGIDTYQHTRDNYIGVRLEGYSKNLLFSIKGASNASFEEYKATPEFSVNNGFSVNLSSHQKKLFEQFDIRWFLGDTEINFGQKLERIYKRNINMNQSNWNFLPPDANSDNPFIYQKSLNQEYGRYNINNSETNAAGFISIKRYLGRFTTETGLRLDYFRNLMEKRVLSIRQMINMRVTDEDKIALLVGSYYENPTGPILGSYQPLIYANTNRLKPLKTTIASMQFSHNDITISIFRKQVNNLPKINPDFTKVNRLLSPSTGFIKITSESILYFLGGSISIEFPELISSKFDLYAHYGYSHGDKISGSIAVPYELNNRHTWYFSGSYKISKPLSIGGNAAFRSGSAYTPSYNSSIYSSSNLYSQNYYNRILKMENSEGFPDYMAINLSISYKIDIINIFGSISNITNHKNPIINSHDGYIYDAGILPSIGLKYSF